MHSPRRHRPRRAAAGHPLPEVRTRALRSLQFKLQQGLLDAASLAGVPPSQGLQHLLAFLGGACSPDDARVGGGRGGAASALHSVHPVPCV